MRKENARTPGVDSARRVLNVLLLFGDGNPWLTVEQIAEQVEVSVPSAYRFLSLLRELELVEENGANTYSLTPRVFGLATSAERAFEVGALLRPMLDALSAATGEAALVIRRVGRHAVCAEITQTEHAVQLSFVPGQVMPLERGAGPKMLLASMGIAEADEHLRRQPGMTDAERTELLAELEDISAQGWAVSSGEVDQGVWAAAAPVTIGRRTVAVLSVAGPRYRIDEERQQEILTQVITAAKSASEDLTEFGLRNRKPMGKVDHERGRSVIH